MGYNRLVAVGMPSGQDGADGAGCGKTDSVQDGYSAAVWFTLLVLVPFAAKGSTEGKTDYWGCVFLCVFFFDMQERVKMTKPLNLGHEIP